MGNLLTYKIAVLEDGIEDSDTLCSFIKRFGQTSGIAFEISVYQNPIVFFDNNPKEFFDIVFLDVEMPGMNGLVAAKKIREIDKNVVLIFVTKLAQFAIKGYAVSAMDYMLKPLNYSRFELRMKKAVMQLSNDKEEMIMVRLPYSMMRIAIADIFFVEVRGHILSFNTCSGVIETRGRLADYESALSKYDFYRCSKCVVVNLRHVDSYTDGIITVNKTNFTVSRNNRKEFAERLSKLFVGSVYSVKQKNG